MTALLAHLQVPGPFPNPVTRPFWDAVQNHQLALQRCADCRKWVFYARHHCPHCWSQTLSWEAASGKGVLKSFSVIHRAGHSAWQAATPYLIALVQLDEGPTMLSQLLVDDPTQARIGGAVSLRCVQVGERMLPFFEPSGDDHAN